jgi:uncharacterized protein
VTSVTSDDRLLVPDVVRAVALIGVVTLNYHGYLNGGAAAARPGDPFFERLLDPFEGVLATRFAATFVLVAGIGVALMTGRALTSDRSGAVRDLRLRLVRRGLTLYGVGFVLDWIWPGTILFFYGAYFVLAAAVCTLRTRYVAAIGTFTAVAAAALALWKEHAAESGSPLTWIDPYSIDSFGELAARTFFGYTHPVLPWFAFFCAGIVLGRHLPVTRIGHLRIAAIGLGLAMSTYLVAHVTDLTATSTRPYDRGLLYTVGTIGTALVAYGVIGALALERPRSAFTSVLRDAGRTTLTIYLAHVFVFEVLVEQFDLVERSTLNAVALALTFWAVALTGASGWQRRFGTGPAERAYRLLGG